MFISIKNLEYIIFFYNFIAHFVFFTIHCLYQKDIQNIICKKILHNKNIDNVFLIIGHILIAFVMLFRIGISISGTIIVSVIGSIGHMFLILSYLLFMFNTKDFSIINIIFILGQLGMIFTYCIEHIFEDVNTMTILEKAPVLLSFITLGCIYLFNYFKTDSILKYGKLAVFFVYCLLILLFFYHNEKYDYISIF
jgi:hypothetical protein